MSEKKSQHLVPQCYLRGFLSAQVPEMHANNPHFQRGVWTTSTDLLSPWRMKGTQNIMAENHYYTLPTDDPESPVIEVALAKLESEYTPLLYRIGAGTLSLPDIEILAYFVSALLFRVKAMQEHQAANIQAIENMYRMVERAHFQSEDRANEAFRDADQIPKKNILNPFQAEFIMSLGIQFLINGSGIGF